MHMEFSGHSEDDENAGNWLNVTNLVNPKQMLQKSTLGLGGGASLQSKVPLKWRGPGLGDVDPPGAGGGVGIQANGIIRWRPFASIPVSGLLSTYAYVLSLAPRPAGLMDVPNRALGTNL